MLDWWFVYKDLDDMPMYVTFTTSDDPKGYYNCMLDLHSEKNPVPRGIALLLRRLISCIPEPGDMDPFVLTHLDFDI